MRLDSEPNCKDFSYQMTAEDLRFSIYGLGPDAMLDLANLFIFDVARWAGRPSDAELEFLTIAAWIWATLLRTGHSLFPSNTGPQERAIEKYGYRNVCGRLLSLVTKDEYFRGKLREFNPAIVHVFCELEVVREGLYSLRGDEIMLQNAWDAIKTFETLNLEGTHVGGLGPLRCLDVIHR